MKYALLATLLVTGAAHAERFSNLNGEKLMQICTSSAQETCISYIEGVSDTQNFYQKLRPADGTKGGKLPSYFCVPTAETGVQMRDAVISWAKAHPDMMSKQASGVVLRALDAAYRCR